MFLSAEEAERVRLKAIEQAMRAAGVAHAELEPLLPVDSTWPFRLTADDVDFLCNCPYPISPAFYELREIIVKVVAEQIWKEHLRRRILWAFPRYELPYMCLPSLP